ncbi:MAG: outer membrane homotrimeric porin [Desulfovibrionaceae bacterium]|nr:outer membrane homotrimeric porin [Desulfovibrionaceae bacterium]
MVKKLAVLLLAMAMTFIAKPSDAVEFKIKGSWQFSFDYINGGNFMGKYRNGKSTIGQQWSAVHQPRDEFEAIERMHFQLEAIASEQLSGTLLLELGESRWGNAAQGGALGADSMLIKVKQAYLDWQVPNLDLKFRMGLIDLTLPGFAMDTPVLQDDVAGIVASYQFNDAFATSAFWLRLLNDNWVQDSNTHYLDNFDLVGLTVPVTLDTLRLTPWGMGGYMGPNSLQTLFTPRPGGSVQFDVLATQVNPNQSIDGIQLRDGLYPAAFTSFRPTTSVLDDSYSSMWWAGLTGQWTWDPLRISLDFAYGDVDHGRDYLRRQGWFAMLLAEYILDWGTPGLYGWYFSGDDDDPHNGSERLPYLSTVNNWPNSLSTFGYRGNPIIGGGKGILGTNPTGTWGVGLRLKDMSFLDNLSHTLRFNFFGGTNSPTMASYCTGRLATDSSGRTNYRNNTDFNSFGTYLTTDDTGLEINLDTTYKVYENLSLGLELGYIHLNLDEDTWGRFENMTSSSLNQKDAWKATVNVIYSF